MKKMKRLLLFGVCVVTLMGCGKQAEESESTEEISALEERSDLESQIEQMEIQLSAGNFSTEDYYALADLYAQDGSYRKERDLLEQCFRLYGDSKSLELLAQITVNLEEESSELRAKVAEIVEYMDAEEHYDAVMRTLKDESWISSLMPKLKIGSRKYFSRFSDSATAYIEVGYTAGNAYAQIWIMDGESIRAVLWQNDAYQVLSCGYEENQYQGDFSLWTINEQSKEVVQENGTLKNGMLTGSYMAKICSMGDDIEAADFWLTRNEASYVVYNGTFDENGVPTIEQPNEQVRSKFLENTDYTSCLVYAYNENQTNCLWMGDTSAMTAEQLQLPNVPTFKIYDVKSQNSTQASVPQIRVYDGVVQWFDGSKWVDVENVTQMVQEDPFVDGGIQTVEGSDTVAVEAASSHLRNVGGIATEKETESTNKKNSTAKKQETTPSAVSNTSAGESAGTASSSGGDNSAGTPSSSGGDNSASTPSSSGGDNSVSTPSPDTSVSAPSTSGGDNSADIPSQDTSSGDGVIDWGWGEDVLD